VPGGKDLLRYDSFHACARPLLPLGATAEQTILVGRLGQLNPLAGLDFGAPVTSVAQDSAAQEIVLPQAVFNESADGPGSQPDTEIPMFRSGLVAFLQEEIFAFIRESILAGKNRLSPLDPTEPEPAAFE
jgi:hypothetical protein